LDANRTWPIPTPFGSFRYGWHKYFRPRQDDSRHLAQVKCQNICVCHPSSNSCPDAPQAGNPTTHHPILPFWPLSALNFHRYTGIERNVIAVQWRLCLMLCLSFGAVLSVRQMSLCPELLCIFPKPTNSSGKSHLTKYTILVVAVTTFGNMQITLSKLTRRLQAAAIAKF